MPSINCASISYYLLLFCVVLLLYLFSYTTTMIVELRLSIISAAVVCVKFMEFKWQ